MSSVTKAADNADSCKSISTDSANPRLGYSFGAKFLVAAQLTRRIHHDRVVNDLLNEFLRQRTYQKTFCLKLLNLARDRKAGWGTRCLAILMAEHLVLKLESDDLESFDELFAQLNIKAAGGVKPSLLKEGYSTTALRPFIREFQGRLARLNRVHGRIRGTATSEDALRDFIEVSRTECKLTLARYLFTPKEVVARIVKEVKVSDGVKDIDVGQYGFVDTEIARALKRLPDFEAGILRCLCEGSKIYWAADRANQRINSLVEYPLTTVVLVIKPPGSDHEFELKRAGRRGDNPFSVVYRRGGCRVTPSHRLDGGSMAWLLRYEGRSAARFSAIYRLVHGAEAPLPGYITRNTVYSIPSRVGPVPIFRYFNDKQVYGAGHTEMRAAMKDVVIALKKDEGRNLPHVAGYMGLTAEYISHDAPGQALLSGTSSFRIDKLGLYLSPVGAETYFKNYLQLDYTAAQAKQFADALLEEVLGVYDPPDLECDDYGRYVDAALSMTANRARADEIFLNLVRQIAEVWGTLLGIKGYSRGESFVPRNVGLRSVWEKGQWKVKLVFMDHDALSLPDHEIGHFFAQTAIVSMVHDERHTWGRANPALFHTTLVGYLMSIYRVGSELADRAQTLAAEVLSATYRKTQHAIVHDPKLRVFFMNVFLDRLLDWDHFVKGYLNGKTPAWEAQMKKLLADKGYEKDAFNYFIEAAEKGRGFLERNRFLYEDGN